MTSPPRANLHAEFVGTAEMRRLHVEQLARFRDWALRHEWSAMHRAHYDWWMFPVDRPSSYGFRFTVYADEVRELTADDAYLAGYREGVRLLLLGWGWDTQLCELVHDPDADQRWHDWPIRLLKCLDSTRLFGQEDLRLGVGDYARLLIDQGVPMRYRGDLLPSIQALILERRGADSGSSHSLGGARTRPVGGDERTGPRCLPAGDSAGSRGGLDSAST